MAARVGEKATGFTLPANDRQNTVSLEDYTSKGLVAFFFYQVERSGVCTDQMGELQAQMGRFEEKAASVLAISADSPWSHMAFAADQGLEFPLLAHFNKEVTEEYGVKHGVGFPERAYPTIDSDGVVRARQVGSSRDDRPAVEAVLRDLEEVI